MVARVDPSGAVELLSVPRDTVVDIEGHGSNRINAAYAFGGAPLMVRTVRESLGLPIHHYVEINFVGFQALVDELGGVTLDFEHPARDLKSGLDVPAGTVTLAGVDALAYARSRSYQEDVDGAWRSMEANDIGRAARQQRLVGAIIDRLARPSTIAETGSVVASFAEHVTVDASLANSSLVELAFSLRNVRGADLGRLILPTVGATLNGASVQVMDEPAASEMLAGFRAGSPMDIEEVADIVTVEVLNGNGVTGSGSRWASHLETAGYEVVRVGDSGSDLATTEIRVAPGYEAAADAVVNDLGFGIVVVGEVEEGRDAVIVLGADAEAS